MLLDFQMPKKNGIQVLQEVRDFYASQSQINPKLKLEEPVYVFLTAFSTVHFRKHLASLGVKNIFEKPIQLEQLKIIFEQNT
jgi:CheY-like chemotaxis protein